MSSGDKYAVPASPGGPTLRAWDQTQPPHTPSPPPAAAAAAAAGRPAAGASPVPSAAASSDDDAPQLNPSLRMMGGSAARLRHSPRTPGQSHAHAGDLADLTSSPHPAAVAASPAAVQLDHADSDLITPLARRRPPALLMTPTVHNTAAADGAATATAAGAANAAGLHLSLPGTATPGTGTTGTIAAPQTPGTGGGGDSDGGGGGPKRVGVARKAVLPNKSKMMALVGEMLPSNALDPTGYENHEAEAKRREEELAEEQDALEEGHVELDQFGNRRYRSLRAKLRLKLRKWWRGVWKVYDPASSNRQYWSLLVVAFLLYGMVEIPIRIGFAQDLTPWSGPDIFNLLVDIFFLVDVVMNFRTGYFAEDNRLVLDERKIAWRYVRSWFCLDLFTSIPLSHMLQAGLSSNRLSALALPRLFRIFRVARLFKILRMLKLMNVMSNWSESTNEKIFGLIMKVLKFVTLIFLLAHLSACVWGFIALEQKDSDGNFHPQSWPYRYGIYNWHSDTTFPHLYLLSLYWALCTLTTVGYGDISAGSSTEYGFCIVLTFIGTCCFGYIIGTISSILKHGKETQEKYMRRMLELNLYMSYRKISPFLQKKIRSHYEYLYKRQTLYNEVDILNELPAHLQADLSNYLYKDLIAKVPFLADMGADCAMLVILKLQPQAVMPGGYVFIRGEMGKQMFFISKGTVDVIDGAGFILCQLGEGSYCGEYSILSEKPVYRTASVRARTFVDLLSLSKADFEHIWNLYPEIYAKIISKAKAQWQLAMADIRKKAEAEAMAEKLAVPGGGKQGSRQQLLHHPSVGKFPARSRNSWRAETSGPMPTGNAGTANGTAGANANGTANPGNITPVPANGGDTVIRIDKSHDKSQMDLLAVGTPAGHASDEKVATDRARRPTISETDADFEPATLFGTPFRGPRDHPLGEHTVQRSNAQVAAVAAATAAAANRGRAGSDADSEMDGEDGRVDDFYDSLSGCSSSNDEDFDNDIDAVDLPPHLLPPPKPLIRGSFVPPNQVVHSGLSQQQQQQQNGQRQAHRLGLRAATQRIKSLFTGAPAPATPAAQARRRVDRRAAFERAQTHGNSALKLGNRDSVSTQQHPGGASVPTTPNPGVELMPPAAGSSKRLSARSSGSRLNSAIAPQLAMAPAEERQAQRRRTFAAERRHSIEGPFRTPDHANAEASPAAAVHLPSDTAATDMEQPRVSGARPPQMSHLLTPGGAGSSTHKATPSTSGIGRGSIFSNALSGAREQPGADADGGLLISRIDEGEHGDDGDSHTHAGDAGSARNLIPKSSPSLQDPRVSLLRKQHAQHHPAAGAGAGVAGDQSPPSPLVISTYHSPNIPSALSDPHEDAATKGRVSITVEPFALSAPAGEAGVGVGVGVGSLAHESAPPQSSAAVLAGGVATPTHATFSLLARGAAPAATLAAVASVPAPAPAPAPAVASETAASSDLSASPLFWQSLQTVLSTSLAPMQSQYQTLLDEHVQLQVKQRHTEQLLRNVVAALKKERAAAAKAAQAASSGAGAGSAGGPNLTVAGGTSSSTPPSTSTSPQLGTMASPAGSPTPLPRRKVTDGLVKRKTP